jgi:hypothetical protein
MLKSLYFSGYPDPISQRADLAEQATGRMFRLLVICSRYKRTSQTANWPAVFVMSRRILSVLTGPKSSTQRRDWFPACFATVFQEPSIHASTEKSIARYVLFWKLM